MSELGLMYKYCDTQCSAGVDEFGDAVISTYPITSVALEEYTIVKTTPKGAWISLFPDYDKRFVLLSVRKKFAYGTKEEAQHNFLCRKRTQIKILEHRLACAKDALCIMETRIKRGLA